ncbi:aldo/keto reductase [Candidatus Poribacteria bacterium]
MKYTKLGNSDMEVSVVAFGCWGIIGGFNWGPQDKQDSIAALKAALGAGITLFDTAEGYGNGSSEQLVGEGLGDRRKEIVIASKVSGGHLAPDQLAEACERSLQNLGTDWIDLYQVHWPNRSIPVEDAFGTLEKLKEGGKIREYAVSNFGVQDLAGIYDIGYSVVSNQLCYNMLFRAIEYDIQQVCVERNIGILCYSPLMQGLLTGKYGSPDDIQTDRARTRHYSGDRPHAKHGEPGHEELVFSAIAEIQEVAAEIDQPTANVALAWLLNQPAVACVIAGGRNPDHSRQNAEAADLELTDDVLKRLDQITGPLKDAMGPNPDMWNTAEKSRIQ